MDAPSITLALIGTAIAGAAGIGARHPVIHPLEARVFHRINRLPDWLYWPLWVPMQLGNLVVGTVVGLVVAWQLDSWRVAVGVIAATVLKRVVERVVRQRMSAYLEVRQRPGTSEQGAILRGADVPSSGPSFPSGHVILVAAVGTVLASSGPGVLAAIALALSLLVALGRVYVGAHNPLDVTAGFGAGLLIGGVVSLFL